MDLIWDARGYFSSETLQSTQPPGEHCIIEHPWAQISVITAIAYQNFLAPSMPE